jgi:hypothetical protein
MNMGYREGPGPQYGNGGRGQVSGRWVGGRAWLRRKKGAETGPAMISVAGMCLLGLAFSAVGGLAGCYCFPWQGSCKKAAAMEVCVPSLLAVL